MDYRSGRYLRLIFVDSGGNGRTSVGEFYLTPNDTTVQFRVGAMVAAGGDRPMSGKKFNNSQRCELIRKDLRLLKVPVLRNRRRTFLFFESNLDTFGPGSASVGALGGVYQGDVDAERGAEGWRGTERAGVDPKMKIDAVQSFPLKSRPLLSS